MKTEKKNYDYMQCDNLNTINQNHISDPQIFTISSPLS